MKLNRCIGFVLTLALISQLVTAQTDEELKANFAKTFKTFREYHQNHELVAKDNSLTDSEKKKKLEKFIEETGLIHLGDKILVEAKVLGVSTPINNPKNPKIHGKRRVSIQFTGPGKFAKNEAKFEQSTIYLKIGFLDSLGWTNGSRVELKGEIFTKDRIKYAKDVKELNKPIPKGKLGACLVYVFNPSFVANDRFTNYYPNCASSFRHGSLKVYIKTESIKFVSSTAGSNYHKLLLKKIRAVATELHDTLKLVRNDQTFKRLEKKLDLQNESLKFLITFTKDPRFKTPVDAVARALGEHDRKADVDALDNLLGLIAIQCDRVRKVAPASKKLVRHGRISDCIWQKYVYSPEVYWSNQNLKLILSAMKRYEKANGHFIPPQTDGNRLSWRVALLPYFEIAPFTSLYRKFKLNESWDSEHNLKLAKEMPFVYRFPADPKGTLSSPYQVFSGPNTLGSERKVNKRQFPRGEFDQQFTIAVIEAKKSFSDQEKAKKLHYWTRPFSLTNGLENYKDLNWITPHKNELIGLGMADGRAWRLKKDFNVDLFRALVAINTANMRNPRTQRQFTPSQRTRVTSLWQMNNFTWLESAYPVPENDKYDWWRKPHSRSFSSKSKD